MYQDSSELVEFGPYLGGLLSRRSISASELSRLMAYKSRNTIFRILDGTCGNAARQAFFDKLIEEDPLGLSAEEREALARALEISRVGAQAYLSNREMAVLVLGGRAQEEAPIRVYGRQYGMSCVPLTQVLQEYTQGRQLRLAVTGCCTGAVMNALREALLDREHDCAVDVVHYVYTGQEEIIANISAIQPMLCAPCYQAYSIRPGVYSPQREQIYRNNCICVHAVQKDGSEFEEALVQLESDRMVRFERRERGGFMMAGSMLGDARLKDYPIKSGFMLSSVTQGLSEYIEQYRQIEYGRAIYSVKLDLPFNFIHPDVLVKAAQHGFVESGQVKPEELDALIAQLYEIQLQRWENTFFKRKPTYMVLYRPAMEAFARTGRQSDHYFALRPYTREERVSILKHIRTQARENPNLFVYFLKEDVQPPLMEITLYDGEGVLLSHAFTQYDHRHSEAIIAQSEFCRQYKTYFTGDLLERRVVSREEALSILNGLVEIAESADEQ